MNENKIDIEIFKNFLNYKKEYNLFQYFLKTYYSKTHIYDNAIEYMYLYFLNEHKKCKKYVYEDYIFCDKYQELIEKYIKFKSQVENELFILKLDVSPDEISIETISKILKYLDSINSDIAKLLGIPKEALIFNLKSIESGSIVITILQGVAIGAITSVIATPFLKGLIGKENIQQIEDMGTLLRETFFEFISSPKSSIDNYCNTSTLKKRVISSH